MIKSVVVPTSMRDAFTRMKIKSSQVKSHSNIINAAVRSMQNDAGVRRMPEWNAHLKHGTYVGLKLKGIMA